MKTVTAAVIVRDGLVMITRRAEGEKLAGLWEFPGGKQEPGETLQACLARELKEELGLDTKIGSVLAETEYHYDHGSILLVAMKTEVLGGELRLTVHDRLEWVRPNELQGFQLAPADVPIAKRLAQLIR